MKVKLIPNHRFQVVTIGGVEVDKATFVEVPDELAEDPRLIREPEPESVSMETVEVPDEHAATEFKELKPAKKGRKK